ncbi:MAG TPA: DNA-3-methyladenine glycosylase [Verrucomicrobiae bacterium]|nr:DNA-3-methyladenine glycosylase [Verrucomicrobiae bacterium]
MVQYKPKTNFFTTLPRSFYGPSAEIVAAKLAGHLLIRNTPQGDCGGIIIETEAYITGDPAAHSFRGQTKRNRAMWGPAGHSYVYFIYGNHWCFNVVCCPPGFGEAVLIRAIEPTVGLETMRARRPVVKLRDLSNGPGKLCAAMDIDRRLDGVDLCDTESPIFVAENPDLKETLKKYGPMVTTTRIGITQAAHMPFRFYLAGSHFVSKRAVGLA